MSVFSPAKGFAIVNNNANVPPQVSSLVEQPSCRLNTYVNPPIPYEFQQHLWLAKAGNPRSHLAHEIVNISQGTDTELLQLHGLTAACFNNISPPLTGSIVHKNWSRTKVAIVGATISHNIPGVAQNIRIGDVFTCNAISLAGYALEYDYANAYANNWLYMFDASNSPAVVPFCLSGMSNLPPGLHTITLEVNVKQAHRSYGTPYQYVCVNPPGFPPQNIPNLNFNSMAPCIQSPVIRTIQVNVIPTGPDVNVANECEGHRITLLNGGVSADIYGPTGVGGLEGGVPNGHFINLINYNIRPNAIISYAVRNASGQVVTRSFPWEPPSDCSYPLTINHSNNQPNVDDYEEPTSVAFTQNFTANRTVNGVNISCFYYVNRLGGPSRQPITPATTNSVNMDPSASCTYTNSTIASLNLAAGDEVCFDAEIDVATGGTVGPGGNIIARGGVTSVLDKCVTVVNRPYLKFLGGDVSTGGGFGGTCNANGGINAFMKPSAEGSGVEFAAMIFGASGTISGFATAQHHGPNASSLAFANRLPSGAGISPYSGTRCFKDYFANSTEEGVITVPSVGPTTTLDVASLVSEDRKYTNDVVLAGNLKSGIRSTIYVQGDVIISNNIDYEPGIDWTNIANVPSLHVIVKGNIYIQSNVRKMVGMFVAQPATATTGGKIVTCANSKNYYSVASLFGSCSAQLKVRGSLIAQKVEWLRTANSLRNASSSDAAFSASNAAETVELSPEFIMVGPRNSGPAVPEGGYQFFTTLPPVL